MKPGRRRPPAKELLRSGPRNAALLADSSFFRTPIIALFCGAGVGAVLWLAHFICSHSSKLSAGAWAFPNAYEQLLVMPEAQKVLGAALLFILWGGLCVAGSTLVMVRRDI